MRALILLFFLVGTAVFEKGQAVPVGECPPKDPGAPVYLPDDETCGIYYECSNGAPWPINCAPGLEFNPTLHVCTQPSESGCTAPDHHATNPPPTTTNSYFDEEFDVYQPDGSCPPHDTNDTIYLSDTANCTIYYVCSNGRAIALSCPKDMEFSPSKCVCVLDIDSDCVPQEEGNETTRIICEIPPPPRKALPKKPVGQCPSPGTGNPVFLPDDANCSGYYECSNGVPVFNTCADGLVWNPKLNTCVPKLDCDLINCNPDCPGSTTSTSTTTTESSTDSF